MSERKPKELEESDGGCVNLYNYHMNEFENGLDNLSSKLVKQRLSFCHDILVTSNGETFQSEQLIIL